MTQGILGPRKPLEIRGPHEEGRTLRKTLGWPHLIALGVGAIVGTGIYTLTGVGADRAGPAIIIAFLVAGAVCACAALAYAEMATLIPTAGSAYTYTYSVIGEAPAWIVGWSLILEYSLACSTVAVGWSGYLVGWLQSAGLELPAALLAGPHAGGIVNMPAILVALAVAGLLIAGTRESATLNIILVIIKMTALAAFVILALPEFNADNMTPFAPHGFGSAPDSTGVQRGVMAAAAIVFFAFYGFDAVATSAEEAKNPGRDLKIGIIGSMVVCTTIYILVAIAAVGSVNHEQIAASGEPLAFVLRTLEHPLAARLVATRCTHRAALGHSRDDVWPEPHLLRDGSRWTVAAPAQRGVVEQGDAGAHHRDHRCFRRRFRRIPASRRDRRAGERGDACWHSSPSQRA